jgi:PII-like signaling protein
MTMGTTPRFRPISNPHRTAVDERPVMVIFIDEEAKVNAVLPELKKILREGLIVAKKVERL